MTSWVLEELTNKAPTLVITRVDAKFKKIGDRCSIDLAIRKKGSAAISFVNLRNQGQEEDSNHAKENWPGGASDPLPS